MQNGLSLICFPCPQIVNSKLVLSLLHLLFRSSQLPSTLLPWKCSPHITCRLTQRLTCSILPSCSSEHLQYEIILLFLEFLLSLDFSNFTVTLFPSSIYLSVLTFSFYSLTIRLYGCMVPAHLVSPHSFSESMYPFSCFQHSCQWW